MDYKVVFEKLSILMFSIVCITLGASDQFEVLQMFSNLSAEQVIDLLQGYLDFQFPWES